MKNHHTLKDSAIAGLVETSADDFAHWVDLWATNDYRSIPAIIKLPKLHEMLSQELGVSGDVFLLKNDFTHFRQSRKNIYGQALRTDEVKKIPYIIQKRKFALVDSIHQNFNLVWLDEEDSAKVNVIVFNKDALGNYIITVKKMDAVQLGKREYRLVGAGVAPAITRSETAPVTALLVSPTTSSIAQGGGKSSGKQKEKSAFEALMELLRN